MIYWILLCAGAVNIAAYFILADAPVSHLFVATLCIGLGLRGVLRKKAVGK